MSSTPFARAFQGCLSRSYVCFCLLLLTSVALAVFGCLLLLLTIVVFAAFRLVQASRGWCGTAW